MQQSGQRSWVPIIALWYWKYSNVSASPIMKILECFNAQTGKCLILRSQELYQCAGCSENQPQGQCVDACRQCEKERKISSGHNAAVKCGDGDDGRAHIFDCQVGCGQAEDGGGNGKNLRLQRKECIGNLEDAECRGE